MAKKKSGKDKTPVQKQKAGIYTMMLIASFLVLVLGCVLLYLELEKYKFDHQAEEYNNNAVPASAVDRGAAAGFA